MAVICMCVSKLSCLWVGTGKLSYHKSNNILNLMVEGFLFVLSHRSDLHCYFYERCCEHVCLCLCVIYFAKAYR